MTTTTALPVITDATIAAELSPTSGLVAVEFGAEWCAPCRIMAPVVEAAARDYAGRLRIVQMDADHNPATVVRYGVRGLPSVLVFRDGRLVDRIVGAVSASTFRERLERVVAG